MDEHDVSWVRTEMALAEAAPLSEAGIVAWVRKNLFATPVDSVLTVLALLLVAWALPQILGWAIFNGASF
jgi:general L-amino acid transport system permease protein